MSSISKKEKQSIISSLEKINCKLKGESIKLDDTKEPIIAARRKSVVKWILKDLKNHSIANCNVMIEAESRVGKTYDIGILSHVLAQAGFHHLVAVQRSVLVNQAKKMMSSAFTVNIRTPKTAEEIKNALKTTKPTTIIVTPDLLFQQENGRKFKDKIPSCRLVLMKQTVLTSNRILRTCASLMRNTLRLTSLQHQREGF